MGVYVLKKKKIKFIPLILKAAVVLFVFYIIFMLVNQQAQINSKKRDLEELTAKLQLQTMKNEELKEFSKSTEDKNEEYIERIARESLDLSKKGERVFINISGN
ncbi:MAG: hypothetical protein RUMPE_00609 [Eubacteriales bacterium SKADARSKE-1]|nr:hypothetical protein [Eubacteriales bacterium SKADARSKE-1]